MKEEAVFISQPVHQLREQVEQDTRFQKALWGYAPSMVNAFISALQAENAAATARAETASHDAKAEAAHQIETLQKNLDELTQQQAGAQDQLAEATQMLAAQQEELAAAQKRERAAAQKADKDEALIAELKVAADAQETQKIKEELAACRRERDDALAQAMVLRGETEQMRARLKRIREENRALSGALSATRKNLTATCNGVEQHTTALHTLATASGTDLLMRAQELVELCASYTKQGIELTDYVRQSLQRE